MASHSFGREDEWGGGRPTKYPWSQLDHRGDRGEADRNRGRCEGMTGLTVSDEGRLESYDCPSL